MSLAVFRRFPEDASTTTQYVVLAESVVLVVKVRTPLANVGLVRVTTSVVVEGSPVAIFTLTPLGAEEKFTSTLVRV